jgi:hypothetical protein
MAQVRGAFPFPIAQVQEGTSSITLYGGTVWYVPQGEYIVNTPSNGVVEWFEPQSQTWRQIIATSQGDYFNSDGFNIRLHNLTGTVTSTTISNAGSGMTNGIGATATGVTLAVAATNTTGYQTALLQPIVGGSVAAPTITNAGSGFLVPPIVVIDPPPVGGIQATAYAVLTATGSGGIGSITMSAVGAGYVASPNFYLIPQFNVYAGGPVGSQAAATIPPAGVVNPANAIPGNQNISSATTAALLTPVALTGSGTLTGVTIAAPGSGYTSASPSVTITGGAGGVAVTATVATNTLAAATFYLTPRVQ